MTLDRETIRFNTLRNALYHSARRRVLERWNRVFTFLVVILGASAAGNVFANLGIAQHWVAFAVAIIGAVQLVFDFGRQARDHQTLQREYFHLLADIEEAPEATEGDCATWYSKVIRITADEPPVLRALDAKAYNDALDAMESHDPGERLHIPAWQVPFAGICAFEGHRYRKLSEIDAARTQVA